MASRGQVSLSLPPLSSTYQSSYLWAPHHLQRLTIDQRHYHNYVSRSLDSDPPHLNCLRRRVQRFGDNHFHFHRDMPVGQVYSLTALRLSNLRPADQLLDRPMSKDSRVVQKEVCQPFPAEHPYTSHISQFSLFPDTHATNIAMATGHTHHRSVGTQTPPAGPLPNYHVTQKAFEKGVRVERHHQLSASDHVTNATDHMTRQLWDLPRSRRHQRSMTYPSPVHLYLATPHTVTPHTQEALDTIHTLVAGTTSYNDHYGPPSPHEGPNKTTGRQISTAGDRNSRPLFSSFSHSRPYTAESRSKYKGSLVRGEIGDEWKWGECEEEEVSTREVATQTEPEDEFVPTWSTERPLTDADDQNQTTEEPKLAIAVESRPLATKRHHHRSLSVDDGTSSYPPRSSISCRRFSQLYAFSHSDVMKQFHSQYPEPVPDLRQYGIQTGRRHTIHGYNSYYFH